ncbi:MULTISPECIES: hypothetical protein [Streptomyces]|uniref:Type II toxin-antitoxin system RelE/ParE family toxin n=1 Tax=Streptomyces luteosporeus TaxID=173856 RepID=A0ABP6GE03_9ACTN
MGEIREYDPGIEAIHDALPQSVSQELSIALAAASDDPLAATDPRGVDDPYNRTIVTDHVHVLLYVSHTRKSIDVLQIHYLD